ncbi:hypothetical protein D9758_009664 [Tetrapyrgos nigripes]|uniref:Alpha-type protein kinase domain-containing protein n=1 Tax=Tetrapyrgos nigripes TaxID=182062 RepID=A0A8H5CNU9_9AGAR|nr:hypothetical protein D9758_009664 [Tetrapyrgos nigripes]
MLHLCPKCNSSHLKPPTQAAGTGKDPRNYNRLYESCFNCDYFCWLGPPTPLEQVPESVQVQFALKESRRTASVTDPSQNGADSDCTDPNCRTAKGKAKKRSQRCPRQRSTQGQDASGLTQPSATPTAVPSVASSSAVSSSQGNSEAVVQPRRFARPLSEGWGQAISMKRDHYEANRQQVESENTLRRTLANCLQVIIFAKANEEAQHFQVTTKHPKALVVVEQPLLLGVLEDPKSFIGVYIPKTNIWVSQEVTVPITVDGNCTSVLLRSYDLENNECKDLDTLVVSLFGSLRSSAKQASGPTTTSFSFRPTKSSSHLAIPTNVNRSFPLQYVIDMVPGLEKLVGLKGVASLKKAFEEEPTFQGCSFHKSTVYEARTVFCAARDLELLEKYKVAGRTEAGRWSELVKEVNSTSKVKGISIKKEPTLTEIPEPSYEVWTVRVNNYRLDCSTESLVTAWSAKNDNVDIVLSTDNAVRGRFYRVIYGWTKLEVNSLKLTSIEDGFNGRPEEEKLEEVQLAVKFAGYNQAPNWWMVCSPSRYATIWTEGSRLHGLEQAYQAFVYRAHQAGLAITMFEVVKTYLIDVKDSEIPLIAQPWIRGQAVDPKELEDDKTFSIFIHWCYEYFERQRVYVDFQAIRSTNGTLFIFNAKTHVM